MTTEHLAILIVLTPAFLFLFWVIVRLEDEIQRLRQRAQLRHCEKMPAAPLESPVEMHYERPA